MPDQQSTKFVQLQTAASDAQKALLALSRDVSPEKRKTAQQLVTTTGKAFKDFKKSDEYKNFLTRQAVEKGVKEAN